MGRGQPWFQYMKYTCNELSLQVITFLPTGNQIISSEIYNDIFGLLEIVFYHIALLKLYTLHERNCSFAFTASNTESIRLGDLCITRFSEEL